MGVGRSDISPPVGTELSGYPVNKYGHRRNKGVHDRLYSRSLALTCGQNAALLINNDLVGISRETLTKTRKAIGRKLGLREENIITTCTHTHSGPITVPSLAWGEVDVDYVDSLPERFLESAMAASNGLHEAKVGFGRGDVEGVSVNRVPLNAAKGAPIDKQVRVLHFKDKSLTPIATLFNYSCHCICVDARTEDRFYVSGDWPSYSMELLGKHGGGQGMFLQGASGDINPAVAWHMRGFDAAEETGRRVADEVLKVLGGIAVEDCEELKVHRKDVKLPLQKLTMKDLVGILTEFLDQLERRDKASLDELRPSIRLHREYAERVIESIENRLPSSIESEMQIMRLGENVLVFLPGEVFVELGREILEKSPFERTLVAGYSGPYVGYIPTAWAYRGKGYESYESAKMLGRPPFAKSIGSVLVRQALGLLKTVAESG